MWQGALTAMISPFRDGRLDEEQLRRNVEYQVARGADGLVPCGTTGESPTLDHDEHRRAIAAVVEASAGRVPVIAGTGSNSTSEALELSSHARTVGADGLLLVNPYYNKPTQEGLYRHFMHIADGVDLPQVLYNIPGRTGVGLAPSTVARLSAHPNIAAIKEASGSMDVASDIAAEAEITLLSGEDSLTLPLMGVGARGVISVASNLVPDRMRALAHAALSGDFAAARQKHFALLPLFRALFAETNPIPIKSAMRLAGLDNGHLRLPLCEPSEATWQRLETVLREQDLLATAGA